jgi:WD40 repeat protein
LGYIEQVAFFPDGKTLAIRGAPSDKTGCVRLWDVKTLKEVGHLGNPGADLWMTIAPDGKSVALAGHRPTPGKPNRLRSDPLSVEIWDVKTRKQLKTIDFPAGGYSSPPILITADSKTLIASGVAEAAALYDLKTGKEVAKLTGRKGTRYMALSGNGKWLITAGEDNSICVWDVLNRKLVHTLYDHLEPVTAVAISPDGKWCASATRKRVWVFDRATKEERARLSLAGYIARPWAMTFTRDGKTLIAVGSGLGNGMAVCDWQAGKVTGKLMKRPVPPNPDWLYPSADLISVALSPDGKILATGGQLVPNRTTHFQAVTLWDLSPPKPEPKPDPEPGPARKK